jgi:hypothetical protein
MNWLLFEEEQRASVGRRLGKDSCPALSTSQYLIDMIAKICTLLTGPMDNSSIIDLAVQHGGGLAAA